MWLRKRLNLNGSLPGMRGFGQLIRKTATLGPALEMKTVALRVPNRHNRAHLHVLVTQSRADPA